MEKPCSFRKPFSLLFLISLICGVGVAQPDTLLVSGRIDEHNLAPYFEMLADSQQMSLTDVRLAGGYLPLDSFDMPLPLNHRIWARAWVLNETSQEQVAMMKMGDSDSVVVYLFNSQGQTQVQTGNYVPPAARSLPLGVDGAKLSFPPGELTEVYVRMEEKSGIGPEFNPNWTDYWQGIYTYLDEVFWIAIWMSLFCGGIMITLIYNLIVSVSLRSRAYLYYSLYLLSILVTTYFAVAQELVPIIGFPFAKWNSIWLQIGLSGMILFYLLFGRSFLETAQNLPRWDRVLRILIGVRLSIIFITFFLTVLPTGITDIISIIVVGWYVVEMLVVLVYLIRLIRLRSTVAWFFIIGSGFVFGGGIAPLILNALLDVVPDTGLFLFGSLALEIIVFSLGLGYKVRQQERKRLAAEQALNQELTKINTAFGRFVPHAFLQSLGHESVLDVKLGDQVEKEVTVLFSDIRAYTTLSEEMTPQENFDFLNAYLGRMGPVIQQHHGFVNQYYGDGIMALFMNEPADALRAAIVMQQELARYNTYRIEKGRRPIEIGIGIHTGPLMMGIIGDTLRLEASVVSDTVNTAARMEGLTKHFGVRTLISETTESQIEERGGFGLRLLGKVQVKGRKQPLKIFHSFDGESDSFRKSQKILLAPFEAGMNAYFQGDLADALSNWEQAASLAPQDRPTQHYLQRTRHYIEKGIPEHWEGVEVMSTK